MHVSTEKAIALREKPPFDIIKVIVVPIAECQKEVLWNLSKTMTRAVCRIPNGIASITLSLYLNTEEKQFITNCEEILERTYVDYAIIKGWK